MKTLIKLSAVLVGLTLTFSTFAADMNTAKNQGLIGERADGYLGIVNQSAAADVKALVRDINAKRRAEYVRIASANGITRQDVESLSGKKTIAKTRAGGWIYSSGWKKK